MENPSRRRFLQISVATLASIPFLSGLLPGLNRVAQAAGDEDLPAVKEGEGQAKALNYCKDAAKAEKSAHPTCATRKSKEHHGEFCRNCQLYTKIKGDGKAEMGKCVVIPGFLVYADGWCNSYTKKFNG